MDPLGLGTPRGSPNEPIGQITAVPCKSWALHLQRVAKTDAAVGISSNATYVGDTRSDFEAATACGLRFVGVDYGFEALRGAVDAPVAADVDELCALLCGPDR